MKTFRTLILGAGALLLVATATPFSPQHEGHKMTTVRPKPPLQHRTITVANGKYSPSTVTVKAGRPVHLMFKLGPKPGCGDVLSIKSLGVKKQLVKGKENAVTFTPKKRGRIPFTCGMGMYRGTINVT